MHKILAFVLFFFLLTGCSDHEPLPVGTVESESLDSEVLQREIQYNIYFPAEMKTAQGEPNVLYLLHGHGGDHNDWFEQEEGNVAHLLDSLIARKAIPPMIAVSLNAGNSWYVDSAEHMESFYLREFISYIEETYGFIKPDRRIIAGNSAGGYGTLRFVLKEPELFDAAVLLSPAAYEPLPPEVSSSRKVEAFAQDGKFNDSIWRSYSYLHRIDSFLQQKRKPKFYLSAGDDDNYNIVPVVTALQQLFLENSVPNELRVMDGGHDWNFWRNSFVNFLVNIYAEN